jgi:hypothetical protein
MTTCPCCGRYISDRPSIRRWRAQGRLLELFQHGKRGPIDLFVAERLAPWEQDYFDRFMARWKRRNAVITWRGNRPVVFPIPQPWWSEDRDGA